MKKISLTRGQVAFVDDEYFEELSSFKWTALWSKTNKAFYAFRTEHKDGKRITIMMHRQIINPPDGFQVDHINHNTLDNQKDNLRTVTNRQNSQNHSKITSSIYPGVCWHKRIKRWVAHAKFNSKNHFLGSFVEELDAFNAYSEFLELINEPEIIMPSK